VWDTSKRPWINADGAPANEIAVVVQLCPSGALHYERKDGGAGDAIPAENRVILRDNGYLEISGDLSIQSANVDIANETRAALCRCGASANKPFCDNAHEEIGFETGIPKVSTVDAAAPVDGKLRITPTSNGSLLLEGNFWIETEAGEVIFTGTKTWLCRCGGSSSKPFCDGTHKKNNFQAD
jgi:CDGSH-type Zn-finger protein